MMALSACMTPNVHEPLTLSQRPVFGDVHTSFMGTKTQVDPVWERIDAELRRRKAKHLAPGSWAALGGLIGASRQTTTNWKVRGVPPKEYTVVAGALGWTVDQLVGADADERPAPAPTDDLAAGVAHLLQMIAATPPHLRLLAVANAESAVMDVRTGTAEVVHSLQAQRSSSRPIRAHHGGVEKRPK